MQLRRWARLLLLALGFSEPALGQEGEASGDHASEQPRMTDPDVRMRNCTHLSGARFEELLRLELSTLGEGRDLHDVRVQVDCFADSIVLSASVGGGPPSDRRIEEEPQTIFERALVLAASEMVSDIWEQAEEVPRPFEPKFEPAAKSPPPPSSFSETAVASVYFGLEHREAPSRVSSSFGVGLTWTGLSFVHLGAEVRAGGGTVETDEATVYEQSLTIAPRIHGALPLGPVRLRTGASFPIGAARLSPESKIDGAIESELTALWVAGLGDLEMFYNIDERLVVILGASAGGTIVPVRGTAQGSSLVEVSGAIVGGRLGLGLSF